MGEVVEGGEGRRDRDELRQLVGRAITITRLFDVTRLSQADFNIV